VTGQASPGAQADVTLITSTYASSRHVDKFCERAVSLFTSLAAEGVRGQLIVVANAPTPVERRALSRLAQAADFISGFSLRILIVPRETLYASWNRGLAAADGQVLGFWNVDDWRNAAAIMEGLDLVNRGHRLIYFPWVEVEPSGWPLGASVGSPRFPIVPEFDREAFVTAMNIGPFFLLDRGLVDLVGCFDSRFRIAGDFEWAIRAARATDFVRGRSIGGVFLSTPAGLSGSGHPRHAAERNVIRLRHCSGGDFEAASDALMAEYLGPTEFEELQAQRRRQRSGMPSGHGDARFSDESWRRSQMWIRARRRALWLPRCVAGAVGLSSSFERALSHLRRRR